MEGSYEMFMASIRYNNLRSAEREATVPGMHSVELNSQPLALQTDTVPKSLGTPPVTISALMYFLHLCNVFLSSLGERQPLVLTTMHIEISSRRKPRKPTPFFIS